MSFAILLPPDNKVGPRMAHTFRVPEAGRYRLRAKATTISLQALSSADDVTFDDDGVVLSGAPVAKPVPLIQSEFDAETGVLYQVFLPSGGDSRLAIYSAEAAE